MNLKLAEAARKAHVLQRVDTLIAKQQNRVIVVSPLDTGKGGVVEISGKTTCETRFAPVPARVSRRTWGGMKDSTAVGRSA